MGQVNQANQLANSVLHCQDLTRRWRSANIAYDQTRSAATSVEAPLERSQLRDQLAQMLLERDRLREQLAQAHEELYKLIAPDLLGVAKGWAIGVVGKELGADGEAPLSSLAMTLYLEIMEALPSLSIDPTQNVRGLLLTVVRRRLTDRYRKIMNAPHILSLEYESSTGGSESSMLTDPHGEEAQEQLLELLEQRALMDEIHIYWRETCSTQDQVIMRRYEQNPPMPFRQVAEQLGPGWTEVAVRMRHHRIVQRTRAYMQERIQRDTEP